MQTVALSRPPVHDILAGSPLLDQPLEDPGLTLLVVLVAVALVLFQALRAVLAAILVLLAPAFVLLRSLVLVGGLILVLGIGLLNGTAKPAGDEPGGTRPSPTSVRTRPSPRPPTPPVAPVPPAPPGKATPTAPDR